jgi:hypothetical protein
LKAAWNQKDVKKVILTNDAALKTEDGTRVYVFVALFVLSLRVLIRAGFFRKRPD